MAASYPEPSDPYAPRPAETSSNALISLIAGIISWFLLPVIGGIVAVITGHMAKREIRESGGRLSGDGMATIGLVLGYLNLGLTVLGVCAFLVLLALGVATPFICFPFANEFSRLIAPLFGL